MNVLDGKQNHMLSILCFAIALAILLQPRRVRISDINTVDLDSDDEEHGVHPQQQWCQHKLGMERKTSKVILRNSEILQGGKIK